MPTHKTELAISYETDTLLNVLEIGTKMIRALQSPEFAEILRRNPDCSVSVGRHSPTIELYLWEQVSAHDPLIDLLDISQAATSADYEGYCVRSYDDLGEIHGVKISRRISVDQRYTADEEEMLRELGRLQTTSTVCTALVCGI